MAPPSYHAVRVGASLEETDLLQGRLYDLGCLGLEESEKDGRVVLKAYFDARVPLAEFLEILQRRLPDASILDATTIGLTDATFLPAPFEPFPLVSSVRVVPPKELQGSSPDAVRSANDIVLMPGPAFGTGRHETTRLVARALWHLVPPPASALDVGTGSGILAILAKKMGIPRVEAVEISEEAIENARGNFLRNGCATIPLLRSVTEASGPYEAVLGNLLTPTILHLKAELLRVLAPKGRMILSGITHDEAGQVEEAFRGFRLLERNDAEDWCCLTLARPD
ncbi:MAG TPA: 50S ribosomal protein L11 methyltransferase [bacterium]|nr:50S ribosomal protein L11 methyltransferase [bacterium]